MRSISLGMKVVGGHSFVDVDDPVGHGRQLLLPRATSIFVDLLHGDQQIPLLPLVIFGISIERRLVHGTSCFLCGAV